VTRKQLTVRFSTLLLFASNAICHATNAAEVFNR